MKNSSETLNTFLNALTTFRKGMYGEDINMDEVIEGFILFFYDDTSCLYIESDRDNNAITEISVNGGENLFVYSSVEDVLSATFDGKHVDFIFNNAYTVFKDILKKDNIEGVFINRNVQPIVYVPKHIIKKVIDSVDQLRLKI